jgi:hypothetical protein
MSADSKTGLQLRSLIKKSGDLEISLVSVPTPEPGPDEVVVPASRPRRSIRLTSGCWSALPIWQPPSCPAPRSRR